MQYLSIFKIAFLMFFALISSMSQAQYSPQGVSKSKLAAITPSANVKPYWSDLTTEQKNALAPLNNEWKNIDEIRKKKWLEIANRFQHMKPDEQERVQARMRDWVKLTPEQRVLARENFTRASALKSKQKTQQWQQYQQLSAEEKQRLITSDQKKNVTNLPSNKTNPNSLQIDKSTIIPRQKTSQE